MNHKQNWRLRARQYLAQAFGGKCTICGYDKTIAALDYHHIDPSQKDKQLSIAMRNGYAWSKIVEEARKCTIVCCRCHRELHAGVVELPDDYVKFNEDYANVIKLKEKEFDFCYCGILKNKNQKYCSDKCFQISSRKFDISKRELEILIHQKPYEEIGRMFGVTGAAIKKRCRSLEIELPQDRRGFWQKKRV